MISLSDCVVGSLSIQAENIEDILTAACILQLSEVIDACSKFLVDHLHPSNCLGMLQFADRQVWIFTGILMINSFLTRK